MNKMALTMVGGLMAACVQGGATNPACDLWPAGDVPLAVKDAPPEGVQPMRDDIVRVCNVSVPQVVVTRVVGATKPTPAVVICPGGGYGILAWNHEGVEVAQWLKNQGIAGVILKYRVPNQREAALADAQRAVRWVRANAATYGIDPAKVGIMGFSAGANLAVRAATNWRKPAYAAKDDVDRESCRPDFHLPIYPWDLIPRKDPSNVWKGHEGLCLRTEEYPVDAETPPAFVVQSEDDFCQVETSLAYYAALKRAKVPAEMHLYARGGQGGHGYGIRRLGAPTDAWPAQAEAWLEQFK